MIRFVLGRSRFHSSAVSNLKIGIVGAGQTGTGLSFAFAKHHDVLLFDSSQTQLDKGMRYIDLLIEKELLKGKIDQTDQKDISKKIKTIKNINDLSSVDIVIEAISENPTLKRDLLQTLSKIVPAEAIVATTTTSISVTKLAASSSKPENVIGMHFFTPVHSTRIAEVIPTLHTSQKTLAGSLAFMNSVNKTAILSADSPGFVATRLLITYIHEAICLVHENIATKKDIDACMKTLGMMGPLEMADYIGLDLVLNVVKNLETNGGKRPCVLLKKYVEAGWTGRKSGRGFYKYVGGNRVPDS